MCSADQEGRGSGVGDRLSDRPISATHNDANDHDRRHLGGPKAGNHRGAPDDGSVAACHEDSKCDLGPGYDDEDDEVDDIDYCDQAGPMIPSYAGLGQEWLMNKFLTDPDPDTDGPSNFRLDDETIASWFPDPVERCADHAGDADDDVVDLCRLRCNLESRLSLCTPGM